MLQARLARIALGYSPVGLVGLVGDSYISRDPLSFQHVKMPCLYGVITRELFV